MEASKEDTHKRQEGKRLKEGTAHTVSEDSQQIGGELKFTKNPKYIEERSKLWEELYAVQ